NFTATPPATIDVTSFAGDFAAYFGNNPQTIIVTATTFNGVQSTVTVTPGSATAFLGFVSDNAADPIQSILAVPGSSSNYAALTNFYYFSTAYPALSIVTGSPLVQGATGTAYNFAMTGSGGSGNYSWSATGLPAGLGMSPGGVISGTPTVAGTSSNIQITLTDTRTGGSAGPQTFAITVLQST